MSKRGIIGRINEEIGSIMSSENKTLRKGEEKRNNMYYVN